MACTIKVLDESPLVHMPRVEEVDSKDLKVSVIGQASIKTTQTSVETPTVPFIDGLVANLFVDTPEGYEFFIHQQHGDHSAFAAMSRKVVAEGIQKLRGLSEAFGDFNRWIDWFAEKRAEIARVQNAPIRSQVGAPLVEGHLLTTPLTGQYLPHQEEFLDFLARLIGQIIKRDGPISLEGTAPIFFVFNEDNGIKISLVFLPKKLLCLSLTDLRAFENLAKMMKQSAPFRRFLSEIKSDAEAMGGPPLQARIIVDVSGQLGSSEWHSLAGYSSRYCGDPIITSKEDVNRQNQIVVCSQEGAGAKYFKVAIAITTIVHAPPSSYPNVRMHLHQLLLQILNFKGPKDDLEVLCDKFLFHLVFGGPFIIRGGGATTEYIWYSLRLFLGMPITPVPDGRQLFMWVMQTPSLKTFLHSCRAIREEAKVQQRLPLVCLMKSLGRGSPEAGYGFKKRPIIPVLQAVLAMIHECSSEKTVGFALAECRFLINSTLSQEEWDAFAVFLKIDFNADIRFTELNRAYKLVRKSLAPHMKVRVDAQVISRVTFAIYKTLFNTVAYEESTSMSSIAWVLLKFGIIFDHKELEKTTNIARFLKEYSFAPIDIPAPGDLVVYKASRVEIYLDEMHCGIVQEDGTISSRVPGTNLIIHKHPVNEVLDPYPIDGIFIFRKK